MATTRRAFVFGALVAAAATFNFAAPEAQAQSRSSSHVPNSYEDFPNNQGSLFYQYRGPGSTKKTRTTPRRYIVQGKAAPQQAAPRQAVPQQYYYVPQQGGQPAYYYVPQAPATGYAPQAPVYYYYPAGSR